MRGQALFYLLSSIVSGAAEYTTTLKDVNACCLSLNRAYPGQIIYQNDSLYTTQNQRWTDNAELTPTCIFLPHSAEEVSAAIKSLSRGSDKNKQNYCPFAVKAGGHTPWAGGNNIDAGVTLDLSRINETSIADDRSLVRIGSGAIWRSVYQQMNGTGLAFPGGRCPGTGVGGLTLGGGYSWFTGRVGFVADNVLNYEIVLASGEIVNANEADHSDLWQALRGGNNNFGVVTRFDVAAFEHSQVIHGGFVIVPANSTPVVLEQLQQFTGNTDGSNKDSGLTVEFVFNGTTGEGQILLWLVDTNSTSEHVALQPFLDIEPQLTNKVATSRIVDYPSAVPPVSRVLMADVTFVNDVEVLQGVHNITLQWFEAYRHIPDLTWDFQYEPLPRHITEASLARGGNIMGLNYTREDLLLIFIMPLWKDAQYDAEVYRAAETWVEAVQTYTTRLGKGFPFQFVNYAAPFQDSMASYGKTNLEFLNSVGRKYDPTRLFQNALKGGYKLDGPQASRGN